MSPDNISQQQELQKEFNDLVLSLSQQVSEKHLTEINKNIKKINEEVSNKLNKHISVLDVVSNKHAEILAEVSKNHIMEINKNIEELNENIPSTLEYQSLALETIEDSLKRNNIDISKDMKHQSEYIIGTNSDLINYELNKIKIEIDSGFKSNNLEISMLQNSNYEILKDLSTKISMLQNNNYKIIKGLSTEIDIKIKKVEKIVIYSTILIILFIILSLAFIVYLIVTR